VRAWSALGREVLERQSGLRYRTPTGAMLRNEPNARRWRRGGSAAARRRDRARPCLRRFWDSFRFPLGLGKCLGKCLVDTARAPRGRSRPCGGLVHHTLPTRARPVGRVSPDAWSAVHASRRGVLRTRGGSAEKARRMEPSLGRTGYLSARPVRPLLCTRTRHGHSLTGGAFGFRAEIRCKGQGLRYVSVIVSRVPPALRRIEQ